MYKRNIHSLCAVVLALMVAAPTALFAQGQKEEKEAAKTRPVTVKPYGFIRNYFNYDSRKTYTVVGGEYNMLPYDNKWNQDNSEDLNAVPHAQLEALTTRIGLNLDGPEVLGLHSSGKIEADFGGFSTNNMVFRIRQAYVKLSKANSATQLFKHTANTTSEILVGQTWHPLSGEIMPEVLGMAAGAPFRPHSRTPQVRVINYIDHVGYTVSLLYQLQYMNNGPTSATNPTSTASLDFSRNAIVPEVFLGLNYKNDYFYTQLGFDFQMLRPRTHADVGGITKKVDESVLSMTPTLYAQFVKGKVAIKMRTLLAENTSHLNQLVGYGVSGINTDGSWDYAPLRATISYLNLAYGKTIRGNLFLGYMKNLGAGNDLYNFGTATDPSYLIYVKGGSDFTNLNSVWRVSPSISYNIKAFNVGLEYELTGATYGDLNTNGSINVDNDNLHQVLNHRICALVKYNF
ncbi:MAG: hypothetical protein IJV22_03680 [Bacteroidales bacterium]|nr:hypothetical protein [Bacteroidales bacterium]